MVPTRTSRSGRPAAPDKRAEAILEAAREVFLERGFAAARVEDVAHRAGVAKGTVYLHFDSKQALFKALIASVAAPPLGRMEALLRDETHSSADLLRLATETLLTQILETDRRLILRLLLTEGPRFPDVAAYHHDEVVVRAMALLRAIVERGIARGEFDDDTLARFPQLFAAPMLMTVIWESLFGTRDPLDVRGMLEGHLELLLRGMERRP